MHDEYVYVTACRFCEKMSVYIDIKYITFTSIYRTTVATHENI